MKIFILLFLLASCGKETEKCKTKEEMIMRCQAEEISNTYVPTEYQLQLIKALCERTYPAKSCY